MKLLKLTPALAAFTVIAGGALGAAPAPGGVGPHAPRGPRIAFEEVDANGDGILTAEEFASHRALEFAKRDQNGDGVLSPAEMKSASLKKASERIDARIARMIKAHDANGDGGISLDELPGSARAEKLIARVDTNGDGAISRAEMEAARKQFRAAANRRNSQ